MMSHGALLRSSQDIHTRLAGTAAATMRAWYVIIVGHLATLSGSRCGTASAAAGWGFRQKVEAAASNRRAGRRRVSEVRSYSTAVAFLGRRASTTTRSSAVSGTEEAGVATLPNAAPAAPAAALDVANATATAATTASDGNPASAHETSEHRLASLLEQDLPTPTAGAALSDAYPAVRLVAKVVKYAYVDGCSTCSHCWIPPLHANVHKDAAVGTLDRPRSVAPHGLP